MSVLPVYLPSFRTIVRRKELPCGSSFPASAFTCWSAAWSPPSLRCATCRATTATGFTT